MIIAVIALRKSLEILPQKNGVPRFAISVGGISGGGLKIENTLVTLTISAAYPGRT